MRVQIRERCLSFNSVDALDIFRVYTRDMLCGLCILVRAKLMVVISCCIVCVL